MDKPIIRKAKQVEVAAVVEILESTFRTTWKPHLTDEGVKHAEGIKERFYSYTRRNWNEFHVVEVSGQIAGMVHHRGNFIESLHVRASMQKLGLGKRLLTYVLPLIGKAHSEVRLETDSFNTQAIKFYESQGFVEIDRYSDEEWCSSFTTVLMTRQFD